MPPVIPFLFAAAVTWPLQMWAYGMFAMMHIATPPMDMPDYD
jgi:hypothetical protein